MPHVGIGRSSNKRIHLHPFPLNGSISAHFRGYMKGFAKTRFSLCAFFVLTLGTIEAASPRQNQQIVACDAPLQRYVNLILKLPNARSVIDQIQKEGPLRIAVAHNALSNKFGAYWDREMRVIGVNMSPHASEGDIIGSIIFELHNALGNSKVDQLDRLAQTRQISREKYVEKMEYLEYQNSIMAAELAEAGIKMGLFPRNARLPTYSCFDEHFYYQKMSGHSNWFAQAFDEIRKSR